MTSVMRKLAKLLRKLLLKQMREMKKSFLERLKNKRALPKETRMMKLMREPIFLVARTKSI